MKYLLTLALMLCGAGVFAQDSLVGTWKGTSICQIKPSACNDEIAVYYVSKTDKANVYHMIMNKVVNGKEEDMGVLDYTFDAKAETLVCYDKKYNLLWTFHVKGDSMEGTLTRGETL
jgi:phage repressor protein C with HTH and peptisase S24 domain